MKLTESQLRRIIRLIIREAVSDEHHGNDDEHSSEEEEPMGDENKIMTVITIAQGIKDLVG